MLLETKSKHTPILPIVACLSPVPIVVVLGIMFGLSVVQKSRWSIDYRCSLYLYSLRYMLVATQMTASPCHPKNVIIMLRTSNAWFCLFRTVDLSLYGNQAPTLRANTPSPVCKVTNYMYAVKSLPALFSSHYRSDYSSFRKSFTIGRRSYMYLSPTKFLQTSYR